MRAKTCCSPPPLLLVKGARCVGQTREHSAFIFGYALKRLWYDTLQYINTKLTHPLQKSHLEVMARNQYMSGDNRDPIACSLFYFALGKIKLVHGLWRQAAWHKEQATMLKFLNNNFNEPRWRTAALKNAFALLSKRRFGTLLYLFGKFNRLDRL